MQGLSSAQRIKIKYGFAPAVHHSVYFCGINACPGSDYKPIIVVAVFKCFNLTVIRVDSGNCVENKFNAFGDEFPFGFKDIFFGVYSKGDE